MGYYGPREFLQQLEEKGELKTLDVSLDVARGTNELMALSRLISTRNAPAVKLVNMKGYNTPDVPVYVGNIGTVRRMCMAMDSETWVEAKDRMCDVITADPSTWPEPTIVSRSQAPCKEVIIQGDDIDLERQIPKTWFGEEWSAMISDNVSMTRDPDTGELNASALLHSLVDFHPDGTQYPQISRQRDMISYIFWKGAGTHVGENYAKYVKAGKPMPIAIAAGIDPRLLVIGGGPRCPRGANRWDKFAMGAALMGRSMEIVPCETNDLYVPADAEWVLEGEVLPDVEFDDYKHGNFLGYYNEVQRLPVTRIHCITRRKDAVWHPTRSFLPPYDHGYLQRMTIEAEVLANLRTLVPEVKDVVIHPSFGGRGMFYVVQLNVDGADKPYPYYGHRVIHAVWGAPGRYGATAKYVMVVGPDIDPYNADEIFWVLNTRVQPKSDIIINEKGYVNYFDPSAPVTHQGNSLVSEQMGIDGLFKVPERFDKLHSVPARPPQELVDQVAAKLRGFFQ